MRYGIQIDYFCMQISKYINQLKIYETAHHSYPFYKPVVDNQLQ
jgi:hypothetical protein